jgi:alanine-alpha-ketoisovalerate/valine-pyruvate aminotransferase
MSDQFSEFGKRLCMGSGIEELMDDLGNAAVVSQRIFPR